MNVRALQVDGQTNPKIQSVQLEKFPIHKAQFSRDGEAVIATSMRNKMFYVYDMMEGRVTPVHTVRGQRSLFVCFDSRFESLCCLLHSYATVFTFAHVWMFQEVAET